LTNEEFKMRVISNFANSMDFKFQYLFAVNVICLIFRLSAMLQFSESIGPLVKIVSKMSNDFLNFLILYFILTVMFMTIGNLNFLYDMNEFSGLFESALTITDASLGNYDFSIFDKVDQPGMQLFG